jgi:hypothetical protein
MRSADIHSPILTLQESLSSSSNTNAHLQPSPLEVDAFLSHLAQICTRLLLQTDADSALERAN